MNHKDFPKTEDIQKKAKTIKAIYQKHLARLNALKREQTIIINQFIKEAEQRKIEEIRKTIKQ